VIRLSVPVIEDDDLDAVRGVLETGYLVQGRHVAEFEAAVADVAGTRHAVAVSSGTAALHVALLALGVAPGDAVATTAYSWIATANVIELCGARPLFVDVDPATGNMSPAALERALEHTSVRAVMPVHAFGLMADMDAVNSLAAVHHIPVVEDAACALGATWSGRPAGAAHNPGGMGCFSFHPRKAVTTGEGGMVVTDDDALADAARQLRNHGQTGGTTVEFVRPGFNYRMTDFQAALGVTQLAKLDRVIAARREAAARYHGLFRDTPITPPAEPAQAQSVYQSYVVGLPDGLRNTDVVPAMRDRGVETTIGTWHLPLAAYYRDRYGHREGDFPGTDAVFARFLTLPLYPGITPAQQEEVAAALVACVEAAAAAAGRP
jgi:dTDP-4-amino-4,6-dideoxygalactose transaminase